LVVTYRPVGELIPDPRNARTHPKRQIDQIRASIEAFGFTNPVLADPERHTRAIKGSPHPCTSRLQSTFTALRWAVSVWQDFYSLSFVQPTPCPPSLTLIHWRCFLSQEKPMCLSWR